MNQQDFFESLGFDSTVSTSGTSSEHASEHNSDNVYDSVLRHWEYRNKTHEESIRTAFERMGAACDERQRELFPDGEIQNSLEGIQPGRTLKVCGNEDHMHLPNDRQPDDFVTGEEEDWGHSRL